MDNIKNEIHDMSEKIYNLQITTQKLTNGQRYAALNEIEKSITPLRNDLHHLEHKLYNQANNEKEIHREIDQILEQIAEFEDLKADLIQKINTETEHTRKFYHEEVMNFIRDEVSPLQQSINENKKEIIEIKEMIKNFDIKLLENEKNRDLKEAERFDRFKWVITAVVAVLAAFSALSLWLEPVIQTIFHIFF